MAHYPLRVAKKTKETADACSLEFAVPQDLATAFAYKAGQFVTIVHDIGGEELQRQYSLSSTPVVDSRLRVTVKKIEDGRMSHFLVDQVQEGDVLETQRPSGRFFVPSEGPQRAIMLAAGSGIAPIISVAKHLLHDDPGNRVILAYGNRTEDTIILREEIDALDKQFDALSVEYVLSRPDERWSEGCGRVDRAYLEANCARWLGDDGLPIRVYLCGPEAFMDMAEAFFQGSGISLNHIRRESFDLVLNEDEDAEPLQVGECAEPVDQAAVTIIAGGTVTEITSQKGESLLESALRAEADVSFDCQEGTCASCMCKIETGGVSLKPHALEVLRQSDLDEGVILACLAQPMAGSIKINFDEF